MGTIESPFLDASTLARRWHCSARKLENMRAAGTGPRYTRTGGGARGAVLYHIAAVEEWEAANTFASTADETEKRKKCRCE